MAAPELELLLTVIDRAYDRRSWHGTNLRGSVRAVSARQARWRPGPGRHNIWEVVVHCAYWKYVVWRRLTGGRKGSFPVKGSNWFRRPADSSDAAWRADLGLLDETHRRLRAAITGLHPRQLGQRRPTGLRAPWRSSPASPRTICIMRVRFSCSSDCRAVRVDNDNLNLFGVARTIARPRAVFGRTG